MTTSALTVERSRKWENLSRLFRHRLVAFSSDSQEDREVCKEVGALNLEGLLKRLSPKAQSTVVTELDELE